MKKLTCVLFCSILTAFTAAAEPNQVDPPPVSKEEMCKLDDTLRGDNVEAHHLTPELIAYLASLHCNALRIAIDVDLKNKDKTVDEQVAPTAENPLAPYEENIHTLDAILPLCAKYRMRVILTAGNIYGRKIDVAWVGTVEGSQVSKRLAEFWSNIAARYKDEPSVIGYDLKNEPAYKTVTEADEWWKQSVPECIRIIRKHDQKAWIVVEPNIAFAEEFPKIPLIDDPRIMYSFHHYWPHGYTHQGVRFVQKRTDIDTRGWWTYPGMASRVASEQPMKEKEHATYWDKDALRKAMEPIVQFQKAHPGVKIFVGEFGVIRWAPNAEGWLRDVIDLIEEQGWHWTYHSIGSWNGWDPTYAPEDGMASRRPFEEGIKETPRLQVVKEGWSRNRPVITAPTDVNR